MVDLHLNAFVFIALNRQICPLVSRVDLRTVQRGPQNLQKFVHYVYMSFHVQICTGCGRVLQVLGDLVCMSVRLRFVRVVKPLDGK